MGQSLPPSDQSAFFPTTPQWAQIWKYCRERGGGKISCSKFMAPYKPNLTSGDLWSPWGPFSNGPPQPIQLACSHSILKRNLWTYMLNESFFITRFVHWKLRGRPHILSPPPPWNKKKAGMWDRSLVQVLNTNTVTHGFHVCILNPSKPLQGKSVIVGTGIR